ncbi:molybdenum cofactor guanylyltransferase [Chitiniphilus eburneus]|uniref:Molybdenum cofactor guanylyltransferase n=2 Tax=Chitiniphilus eburneus TaxID=2571148 RepID=A0A4U0PH28_9NEIS|nr:molybdenum cofactor guanylyltransferase [Chitiniphilus eburneus]
MGGRDKGLLPLAGMALVDRLLRQLRQWPLRQIHLSANRHLDDYAQRGHPVLPDLRPDYPGPLAGIEAGLSACLARRLLVVPCDVPRLPPDLFDALSAALDAGAPLAWAADAARDHPGICLIDRGQLPGLRARLDAGERGVARWQHAAGGCAVRFDFAFDNLNDAATLARQEHAWTD